jgi:hypothetical protein
VAAAGFDFLHVGNHFFQHWGILGQREGWKIFVDHG